MKATEEGKPASVKVSFKVKKTGKTSKYSYVSKVNVIEDKLTLTAEATHVNEIVVTANKAFEDASKVKATVKKGTADRAATATVEGSKITLAMEAKLTKGSYTITVEGAEDTAITVPLEVEKDETLTTFWIADNLVADSMDATTSGSIKYAALNQYGDKMVSNAPTVSCSFGTVGSIKAATATAEGKIPVTGINSVLAIEGVKGTVVLVGDMGVTASKEITYSTFSKAVSVDIAGTYHVNSATMKNISEGDKPSEYELLFTAKDQYGYNLSADEISGVEVTVIAGLTGVSTSGNISSFTPRTVKGVDYIAVPLAGTKAYAGDATLTIVNKYYGLLNSSSLTIGKKVDIANVTITADNGVYENQDNVMGYEIVDTNGNTVTDYATLNDSDVIDIRGTGLRWEKNKDGSAKLIYTLSDLGLANPNDNTDKAYTTKSVTVKANPQTGGNYIVKTFSFTVNEKRVVKSVTGIAADTTTAISKTSTGNLTIASSKFVFVDQYSNKVVDGDKQCTAAVKGIVAGSTTGTDIGTAVYVADNGVFDVNIDVANAKIIATPSGIAGTATVYLKYDNDATSGKNVTASPSNYDAKFTISAYDTTGVDVSSIKIKSVNDGFTVTSSDAANATTMKNMLTVVATVGGSETVIPADQYVIVKNENNSFGSEDDAKDVKTKTAKITVQVTTWDSSNTNIETQVSKEYEVSRDVAKLYKVTGVVDAVSTASINSVTTFAADTFVNGFKFKNQYGIGDCEVTDAKLTGAKQDSVVYNIQLVATNNKTGYTISSDGLNSANVKIKEAGTYTFKITATTLDGSSKDFTWTVTW